MAFMEEKLVGIFIRVLLWRVERKRK